MRPAIILSLFLFSACAASEKTFEQLNEEHFYYDVDSDIESDEEMESYIRPFVHEISAAMDRIVTVSEDVFVAGRPEGPLGNLAADIVRYRAIAEMRRNIHVSVMNNGGLRAPLPAGEVTVGNIYELIPFENRIVVLRLTGGQLERLAHELAAVNGEPVSGIRFRIENGKAHEIMLGFRDVDADETYWVATNSWMADGGGALPTLWEPVERIDLDVLVRDALIEYLQSREQISPVRDQRIRN